MRTHAAATLRADVAERVDVAAQLCDVAAQRPVVRDSTPMHQIGRLWREGSAALSDDELPGCEPPLAARLPPKARQQLRVAAANGIKPAGTHELAENAIAAAAAFERTDTPRYASAGSPPEALLAAAPPTPTTAVPAVPARPPVAGEENPAHILVAFASFASHQKSGEDAEPGIAEGGLKGEAKGENEEASAEPLKKAPAEHGAPAEPIAARVSVRDECPAGAVGAVDEVGIDTADATNATGAAGVAGMRGATGTAARHVEIATAAEDTHTLGTRGDLEVPGEGPAAAAEMDDAQAPAAKRAKLEEA
jgi:hypothetical protein